MSEASKADNIIHKKGSFACAEEAAALLNCVADKKYNDMRCIPLMKKLRVCIEKKVKERAVAYWLASHRHDYDARYSLSYV